MFIQENTNPKGSYVGDCVIRAISIALDMSWERVYAELAVQGFVMSDMPSSNHVWSSYLGHKGFLCAILNGYTVESFAEDYPSGTYILATGSHVIPVIDGDWIDTWDSGEEVPIMYFYKERNYGL